MKNTVKLKKSKINVSCGIVNITNTFNNTIITVSDLKGNTVCWSSAGIAGFKGSRKNTPFAAQSTAKLAALKALEFGVKEIFIKVIGRGNGRETAIRTLKTAGLRILSIEDKTEIPYNGCRPPKKRRI